MVIRTDPCLAVGVECATAATMATPSASTAMVMKSGRPLRARKLDNISTSSGVICIGDVTNDAVDGVTRA
jgi:hypothetical protein